MKSKHRFCRGFTLAELLIVVAIIGVLVAVAIPVFAKELEESRRGVCLSNMRSMKSSLAATYMLEEDAEPVREEFENNKGLCVCPSGGNISYSLDEEKMTVTVSCSIHSPDSRNRVVSNLDKLLAKDTEYNQALVIWTKNGKEQKTTMLEYLQNYFSPKLNTNYTLDSTGQNFGEALRTGIAQLLNISENFDFRIYHANNSDEYRIYISDPIADMTVTAGDPPSVAVEGYIFKANNPADLTQGFVLQDTSGEQTVTVTTKSVDGKIINCINAADYIW